MPEKKQCQPVDTQRMLEATVGGRGVDQRDEAQLGNPREAAKLGTIDQVAYPLGEGNIQLRGEAYHSPG